MTFIKMAPKNMIHVDSTLSSFPAFHLSTPNLSYRFHVSPGHAVPLGAPIPIGELVHDHFGAPTDDTTDAWRSDVVVAQHEAKIGRIRREFGDAGRGDYRLPAVHLRHSSGHTVTAFKYVGHVVRDGKLPPAGLPGTFGQPGEVQELEVEMLDERSGVRAFLRYAVFAGCDAVARSVMLRNEGTEGVEIQRLASWAGDMEVGEWEMMQLSGEWTREVKVDRRKVYPGIQGFQSYAGYSSHLHNPFVGMVSPSTTETTGPAYGFNLVYTGSHSTEVERLSHGYTRVLMGLNPLHLSWTLGPNETFSSPEAIGVYSASGLGGMSRAFHKLYRRHLSRSEWTLKDRPVLLNNWEGTYFDFDAKSLLPLAAKAAELGVKLFVMDDGWFGDKHARVDDHRGLGDMFPNPARFPDGLGAFVDKVTSLKAAGEAMRFGIWVEPEMVNPESELYEAHPDWALHAADHERTEQRYQLVLNLGLVEVQDYIIDALTTLLRSADVSYVKWDNNRLMHELPSPSAAHAYMLGLYRVLDTLTSRFPHVLWEGCASGGGRFDAGILHYFPQTWTSDNTDALERIYIQFGTSVVYPASAMGCHVSAVPNHQTNRLTPLSFRAHVALMGGSFGFELDPLALSKEEQRDVPYLVALAERVNPYVVRGEQYKLQLPTESNWPAVMYVQQDEEEEGAAGAVLLAYQCYERPKLAPGNLVLQGLDPTARYEVDFEAEDGVRGDKAQKKKVYSGATLMGAGLRLYWKQGDFQSKVIFLTRV